MDLEYHRVLARDSNPFAFLYSGEIQKYSKVYINIRLINSFF